MALEDIRNERIKKLALVKDAGINPYPADTPPFRPIAEILSSFSKYSAKRKPAAVAGRIAAKRGHGSAMFLDIKDYSGKIQVYFKKDRLTDSYDLAASALDVGDFIFISGRGFITKRGEKTIEVLSWRMLAKSIRPLPEKREGLKDTEERFRKRYLDLLADIDVRKRFETRSAIISHLRGLLTKEGFLEVETPILQPIPGGAEARPFVTHHNALNTDFYLRIAPELYLKRLLIGGFEKVFEIGRNFRNEGIDRDHNPEFTMLELYWAYQDRGGLMKFTENLLKKLIKKFGDFKISSKKWEVIEFADAVKKYSKSIPRDFSRILPGDWDKDFKQYIRPNITGPAFVIDYPEPIMALAKLHLDKTAFTKPLTESFQLIVNGSELAKGFSEMNDPQAQREQMERQEKELRANREEPPRLDEDFLEALEYGMPPAAGLGIGIDRLVMLLTDSRNIREVVLFPTLRPKN